MLGKEYLALLRRELRPGVGCAATAAIAMAAARTKRFLNEPLLSMDVALSSSMYKNAFAVTVPGTSETGIELAAALGAVLDRDDQELGLFDHIVPADLKRAKGLRDEGGIRVTVVDPAPHAYYIHILARGENNTVETWTEHHDARMTRVELNGEMVQESPDCAEPQELSEASTALLSLELADLILIVEHFPEEELNFLLESVRMNRSMAEKGMEYRAGLGLGHGLKDLVDLKILSDDLITQVRIQVASACDGRLGGLKQPVMGMTDSGNQGILVALPIAAVAQNKKISQERMLKGLALGYLITIYMKQQIEWFPLVCGTAISAGIGVSAAIAWMMGGSIEQIEGAARNATANLAGMLCDGAKGGCALKLAASASESVLAAFLALDGTIVNADEGIVAAGLKETTRKVAYFYKHGKENPDQTILEILQSKHLACTME